MADEGQLAIRNYVLICLNSSLEVTIYFFVTTDHFLAYHQERGILDVLSDIIGYLIASSKE